MKFKLYYLIYIDKNYNDIQKTSEETLIYLAKNNEPKIPELENNELKQEIVFSEKSNLPELDKKDTEEPNVLSVESISIYADSDYNLFFKNNERILDVTSQRPIVLAPNVLLEFL